MIFVIGGAFQGKLTFAKTSLGVADGDVFVCDGGEIDFSRRCICHIERFVLSHPDPVACFRAHRPQWENSVLILDDIFCGVVPMGEENRVWRQKTGRLAQYLSGEASQVSRIFCGLELRLK